MVEAVLPVRAAVTNGAANGTAGARRGSGSEEDIVTAMSIGVRGLSLGCAV